ncbi:leucyl/phenylalanyl-tRNA--protein transferase [Aliishimia ponticola]|uniref:Leucyl/phenylalanyl-tRNA--protein transferase n=1 Tax=Aliishimia ponticola TaxID=2499833 RepID=A0A4S4NEY4_9RHOB|nr:leucyl/phenylalanyl-tRNA--protein transferase [Aliishimia ponticola]THH38069.1 leucyl/phenylalanyl-tRNA--protein transferase [Aliishimia ponticola]
MKDDTGEPFLTPELLLHGYSIGIFPMAERRNDPEVFWVDPKRRGIIPMDGLHLSRSLKRRMRKPDVSVTLNRAFDTVLDACGDRDETWINDELAELYRELHRLGRAHSLEVWYGDRLAGGVYGVSIASAFFGESMFSNARDGSKIALACLLPHLRACGFRLFDTQFITPHLASLGGIEITRQVYHQKLEEALRHPARIDAVPLKQPQDVIQPITQMS